MYIVNFAPCIFSHLSAFLYAKREGKLEIGIGNWKKDRKSVHVKLAGKNFTALVIFCYVFSIRLTIVCETIARVPNAIFTNFPSVFPFKSDNLNVN